MFFLCCPVIIVVLFSALAIDARCRVCRRWWAYMHEEGSDGMECECVHCGHTQDLATLGADAQKREIGVKRQIGVSSFFTRKNEPTPLIPSGK